MPEPETKPEPIKRGDVFLLGRHRLMCGDACSLIDIQKLMDGKKAEMIFTDPTYNIDYKPEERKKGGRKVKELGGMIHDIDFNYKKWFKILETDIFTGSVYITNVVKNMIRIKQWMDIFFKKQTEIIIWVKNNHTLLRRDYHSKYELLFYNRTERGHWNGGRDQKNVWFVKQRNVNDYLHPTQKPLRLIRKAITNSSFEGDIVLDPFGGSGSTLIAAEQTGRICYMMELDPKYCNVIIQRYEKGTEKKAEKIM